MFRTMRRSAQQLPQSEAEAILREGTSGVLALSGDGGYPYAVPISYAYHEGRLLFHCAPEGHKPDAIRACDKASFCVIARDDVVPEKFTTMYKSVIAFGRIREAEGEEKRRAILALAHRFAPDEDDRARETAEDKSQRYAVLIFDIEHMTGKEGSLLAKKRGESL